MNGLDEGQLIEEYVSRRDETAFEAIVLRHGPMVLGACRQLLRDLNDVDDAFQATFLILAKKAGSLRNRELLGNWLYGVAYRVASRAMIVAARRRGRHRSFDQVDPQEIEAASAVEAETAAGAWLHEELNRLPEKYRAPIILCYFEGLTHEEASGRLHCPLGTLKGRLSHAKELLRRHLRRQDVDSAEQDLSNRLQRGKMRSAIPQLLLARTVGSVQAIVGKNIGTLAGSAAVSESIIDLVQGVSQAMTISQFRAWVIPGLLALGATLTGASVIALHAADLAKSNRIDAGPNASQVTQGAAPSSKAPTNKPVHDGPQRDSVPSRVAATLSGSNATQSPKGGKPNQTPRAVERGDAPDGPLRGTAQFMGSKIRQFNTKLAQSIAHADPDPRSKAVMKKLEEPISMVFPNETPLEDVLKYIQSATSDKNSPGLPIYVDPRGLEDHYESMQSTVIINLEGIPLRTTLHLTLQQIHLAYCVRDGVVIVSSVMGIKQELEQIAAEHGIPVPELARPLPKHGTQHPAGIDSQKQK